MSRGRQSVRWGTTGEAAVILLSSAALAGCSSPVAAEDGGHDAAGTVDAETILPDADVDLSRDADAERARDAERDVDLDEDAGGDGGRDSDAGEDERVALLRELVGFGAETTGGADGAVYQVSTLEDDGPGSLRHGAAIGAGHRRDHEGEPLWILFDVEGTIALRSGLNIGSNTTIDGRGADVQVSGFPLRAVDAQNVIVTDLVIGNHDQLIGFRALRSQRLWLHHLHFTSITGRGDPLYANSLAIMDGTRDATVSWCRFTDQDKAIETGNGNRDEYLDDESITVTYHHNFFDRTGRRHPRLNRGRAHAFNNVLRQWACNGYGMVSVDGGQLFAEANVLEAPACARPCPARIWGIRGFDILDGACTIGNLGRVQSPRNLLLGGADRENRGAAEVFDPSAFYTYEADVADAALRVAVEAGAGPRGP